MSTRDENASKLVSATNAFDLFFSNDLAGARKAFGEQDSPFHQLGLGVTAFLEAALGMETGLMVEASKSLTLAEAGAKKQQKSSTKSSQELTRFTPGLEWEILQADAVIMLGLTQALSESYMGYLQCLYSLNNAHTKFTKLYKTVFPQGLDEYRTPAASPFSTRTPSTTSLSSKASSQTLKTSAAPSPASSGFFGRWGNSSKSSVSTPIKTIPDGPIEELVIAGTSFGFGMFNLVFSLLPAKVRGVVGWLGFKHDRKLALQALAVSAARRDVHSVFAGLVLMTYHGVVLLLSGYQADEENILEQYRAIVDSIESRYPTGALWILNRAKIMRMSYDPEGAIRVLQVGLSADRPHSFSQADMVLVFELAWTLLSQRRYAEASDMFVRITELNNWSHATYYFIAAGCQVSLGNHIKAQEYLDLIPSLLEKRKINGKDLPTEVLIKKKLAFYKEKQKRRGGVESKFVEAIKISPAEELGIFWNTQARIPESIALEHIAEWNALTPTVSDVSPIAQDWTSSSGSTKLDLDTPDEIALRSLLLGITHRSAKNYNTSRKLLTHAQSLYPQITVSTWIGGLSMFELAVLDLKETEAADKKSQESGITFDKATWKKALSEAGEKLEKALSQATSNTDLSSRLDSRINMLKDEIATKKEMLGL